MWLRCPRTGASAVGSATMMPCGFTRRTSSDVCAISRAPCLVVSSSVVISSVIGTRSGSARAATMAAATGPFMSVLPRPCRMPSVPRRADHGSSCQPVSGTVSMCPDSAMPPIGPRCATSARFATPASSV